MADSGRDGAGEAPHVVVVGGGIAGLAAAFFLRDEPVRVTVLEGSSTLGGKLTVSEVAGAAVDEGAEGLYIYRPKTTGLIADAGLGEQVVTASAVTTSIWTRGGLRPLPVGQFMGVPSDLDELAASGLLSDAGVARAREDGKRPATPRDGDVSVASFVAERFGQEVVDRLVDPFLSEVCSGRSEDLSFEAMLAPLANASRTHASFAAAAGSLIPPPPPPGEERPPGIATIAGGLGTLPPVLADAVRDSGPGSSVRTGAAVSELARTERGWRLTVGSSADPEYIDADAVIVAVPAGPAGKLLAGTPGAAAAVTGLAEIPYTSRTVITLAYPRGSLPAAIAAQGCCGYRVPAVDGKLVKAVTFSTVKWPHMSHEVDLVRCTLGRVGEDDVLMRDDADLVAVAVAEFAEATGTAAAPVATRVNRWVDGLPQYTVGHPARVARIQASVAELPGLAVCGAAYEGVGVGNCVASARKAARQVAAVLRKRAAAGS
ncbi:protoporphyrinogen oxidase [Streptomyces sp. SID4919]|uniref:protoporphyrinogen oxidase n=1 Tax=unclassified Streptomyces TaxID=2593676 RepID=UPI000823E62E|nr:MULTISPECIES: protoporphyrinogen oxidase [unclassified Streptomyces]MYY11055.1 protoporphyrinogen oxidase [Streptomyces sp. SID4919]SCK14893.1 oxygen-dependent protoporphyrinogen oxidase [Streptomyces sp. AmelKG-E11A]